MMTLRLHFQDTPGQAPRPSWPWAVACGTNVTARTTTNAELEYSYAPDDAQRHHLAYNGMHYRPYCVKGVSKPVPKKTKAAS
eukprot:6085072-Amphidinium_carterae.1